MPTAFTIVIPTHDRRETAVLAARSALAQTRPPDQVLVLCDGCSDDTADALRGLGAPQLEALDLAKAEGYGYEHRNLSLELARGEAILWLADDDLLAPDHLERIGELWDTGRFDLVQSDGAIVHPDDAVEWFGADWRLPVSLARLELANSNPMSAVSLRVDVARAVGGWDAGLERAADWDLWRRALAAGARSARSAEPTVLHFPASGRAQVWPLRVLQNDAWLERLADPRRARELRIRLRRAGAQRAADAHQRAEAAHERANEIERYAAGLASELDAHRAALGQAQARIAALGEAQAQLAALDARTNAAEAEVVRATATLARVYDGGWWRLRGRLHPLIRLARWARDRTAAIRRASPKP